MPLNTRQKTFVEQYIQTGSATKAAQAAQYSAKTASAIGSRLLKNVEVRQAIEAAQHKAHDTAGVTMAMIAKELAGIGLATVGQPVQLSHKLKALDLLTRHIAFEDLAIRVGQLEQLMQRQAPLGYRRNGHAQPVESSA